jgi:hypothetical protein
LQGVRYHTPNSEKRLDAISWNVARLTSLRTGAAQSGVRVQRRDRDDAKSQEAGYRKTTTLTKAFTCWLEVFELSGVFSTLNGDVWPVCGGKIVGPSVPCGSFVTMTGAALNADLLKQIDIAEQRVNVVNKAALQRTEVDAEAVVEAVVSLLPGISNERSDTAVTSG